MIGDELRQVESVERHLRRIEDDWGTYRTVVEHEMGHSYPTGLRQLRFKGFIIKLGDAGTVQVCLKTVEKHWRWVGVDWVEWRQVWGDVRHIETSFGTFERHLWRVGGVVSVRAAKCTICYEFDTFAVSLDSFRALLDHWWGVMALRLCIWRAKANEGTFW